MSKSRARFLAEVLGTTGLVKKSKSALAGADEVIDLSVLPSIPNSKLTNSSITINSSATSLGGSVTLTTANVAENTNLYYTDTRARAAISVSGNAISYNSSTGVLTSNFEEGPVFTSAVTANAGITVDNITIDGNEIDVSSGDMTLDVAGDIFLNADGGQVYFQDGSTLHGSIDMTSGLILRNHVSDADVFIQGNDGGTNINALTFDMSQAGRATFNEGIVLKSSKAGNFGVNINTPSGDSMKLQVVDTGSAGAAHGSIEVSDGNLTLDVAGDIILDADGGDVRLKDNGTEYLNFYAGTIERTGSLTFDVSGNITLNADGSTISLNDDTINFGQFYQNASGQLNIYAPTQDKDILFLGNDGGSTVTALRLDMSAGGTAFFADDVRLTDNHAVRLGTDGDIVFYHDNSNGYLENGSGNLILDVASSIILDSDAGNIYLRDHNTDVGLLSMANTDLYIRSLVSNRDIIFQGYDSSSNITALTLDMSEAGAATFNSNVTVGGNLTVQGTTTTLNTANLQVEDKNITLNYGTGDTSASANGAGITIQDAVNSSTDATILWNAGSDRFDFSHKVNVAGDVAAYNYYGQDYYVLNANADGWHKWAERSGGKVNLNVNSISSGAITSSGDISMGTNQIIFDNNSQAILIKDAAGTASYVLYQDNADTLIFGNSTNVEKIRFDTSGNEGALSITTNGVVKIANSGWGELHLDGASGGDLILKDNGVNYGEVYAGNGHGMVLKAHSGQSMHFLTNGAATPKALIDTHGTMGLGTTDLHNWATFDGRLRLGAKGVYATTAASAQIGYNWYYDGNYKRIGADGAHRYYQNGGNHIWETATSAAADSTITWVEMMKIDGSGNLGIGGTPVSFGTNTRGIVLNGTGSYQHLTLQVGGVGQFNLYTNGTSGTIFNQETSDPMYFNTGGVERWRIDEGGALSGTRAAIGKVIGENIHWNGTNYRNINGSYGASFLQMNSSGALYFRKTSAGSGNQAASYVFAVDDAGRFLVGGSTPPAHTGLGDIITAGTQSIIGNTTSGGYVGYNMYYNSDWKRQVTAGSVLLSFENDGDFTVRQAASGAGNSTISYSENFKVNQSSAFIEARGASQVRLSLGSAGTAGTNTANWIRGRDGNLQFNAGSGSFTWEVGGTARMELSSSGVLLSGGRTAVGIGSTPSDHNYYELGPGYLQLNRDDTVAAQQLQFGKNGAVHSYLETSTSGLEYVVNSGMIHRFHNEIKLINTNAAPTNGVSNPPILTFEGHGWDSDSGSNTIKAVMQYSASYGDFGYGATQGALKWSIQGAGGLDSDTPESLNEILSVNAQGDVRFGVTGVYTNGYSRNISIIDNYDYGTNDWGEYMSWVGTNIKWNYTTDTWMRATQHSNYNWGGISGIAYLSDSLDFVVAPANAASGDGAESNVSDLKALVKMKLQADGKLGINTYSPNGRLEVEVNEGEAGFLISSSSEDTIWNKTQTIQTMTVPSGSGTWMDVAYIGHSNTIRVMGKTRQSGSDIYGGASTDATIDTHYGSSSITNHHQRYVAMNGGDVTGNLEYRYLNSGASSGNYRLQARMFYSGGAHKIYTTITGMSHDYIKEDD